MNAEQRRVRIENYLQKVEFASLDELSQQVNASASTIRRDLSAMEAAGNIRRTHGGARLVAPRTDEFSFLHRGLNQQEDKERIGAACEDLIENNQTVICDAGTTVFIVAKHLESRTPQILTNSLPIATYYASNSHLEVILSGGVIYPRLGVLVGPLAVDAFRRMNVDVAIMGAGGLTEEGATNSHVLLIDIQRAMMAAATKVILCLDASKIGRKSVTHLCGLDQIDVLVTTADPPKPIRAALEKNGTEIIVA
jgi:DeoR/GlpR family transcriptional regulator of sugar metabolism